MTMNVMQILLNLNGYDFQIFFLQYYSQNFLAKPFILRYDTKQRIVHKTKSVYDLLRLLRNFQMHPSSVCVQ